jgi:hypothetical protein
MISASSFRSLNHVTVADLNAASAAIGISAIGETPQKYLLDPAELRDRAGINGVFDRARGASSARTRRISARAFAFASLS